MTDDLVIRQPVQAATPRPTGPGLPEQICVMERLHKAFGGIRAVWDVSFSVDAGQVVGLIGPNGSGKTTVMNLIAGYLRPDAGEVVFRGRRLAGLPANAIARLGLVRTWQDPRIIPDLTTRQNIELGPLASGAPHDGADELITSLLEEFGLRDVAQRPAGVLSYGAQKVVAIARSLAAEPQMLLLDEPLAGLSAEQRDQVVAAVQRFRKSGTVLIVDHSFGVIAKLCDRVVVLNAGGLLTEGRPDAIAADPKVAEVYFG
jgi:ABC-type branched-subunit amino acid transport system ATPase component